MERSPDFYLTAAGEYTPLTSPRGCWETARLRDEVRDDYMLVEIEPPLAGHHIAPGIGDVKQLILASRHKGQTLYPMSEWPAYVYVARILDAAVFKTLSFKEEQVEMVTRASIYRTLEEAADDARMFPASPGK